MAEFCMADGDDWDGNQQIIPQLKFLKLKLKIYSNFMFGGKVNI